MNDPNPVPLEPPINLPISVALARALAEAADGLAENEEPFYLVAPYTPVTDLFAGGFRVYGPYPSFEKVPDDLKAEIGAQRYGFFGRFQMTPAPASGFPVDRVDLHIQDWSFTFPIRPDVLFFTPAAVEKFALPYYERIFGPDFARMVKEQFAYANVQVMAHYPWSEYSDGTREPPERVAHAPVFLLRGMPGGEMHALAPGARGTAVLRPVIHVGLPGAAG